MEIRVHAIVSGRVQGVYYRASTQEKATSLGLTGWVKNLTNGNVEFEAEGEESAVNALLQWAHEGPAMANVTQLDTTKLSPSHQDTDFSVRY